MAMADTAVDKCRRFWELIPGLPEEIALQCLVRVPYQFHSILKLVCRGWRILLSHPSFYQERRLLGAADLLLCLIQPLPSPSPPPPPPPPPPPSMVLLNEEEEKMQFRRIHGPPVYGLSICNVTQQKWHGLTMKAAVAGEKDGFATGITIPMFCQCVALQVSGKILLIGGWDPVTLEPVPDVYRIDLVSGNWKKGAPMSVARSFFACAAVGDSSVYVAGGHDGQKNALRSAEVYDVEVDEWKRLPDMAEERDECQGLSWKGDSSFWVVSGYGTEIQGQFRSDAEVYDPVTGSWSKVESVWPLPRTSPRHTAAVGDWSGKQRRRRWWWVGGDGQEQEGQGQHQREMGEVREYDWDEKRWKAVKRISQSKGTIGSGLCVGCGGEGGVGDRMFVMGGGGESCARGECGGEGTFMLESDGKAWEHVHTRSGFLGLPFSASGLHI